MEQEKKPAQTRRVAPRGSAVALRPMAMDAVRRWEAPVARRGVVRKVMNVAMVKMVLVMQCVRRKKVRRWCLCQEPRSSLSAEPTVVDAPILHAVRREKLAAFFKMAHLVVAHTRTVCVVRMVPAAAPQAISVTSSTIVVLKEMDPMTHPTLSLGSI